MNTKNTTLEALRAYEFKNPNMIMGGLVALSMEPEEGDEADSE